MRAQRSLATEKARVMRWLALSTGADVADSAGRSTELGGEVWRLAWPAITHMLLVTLVLLVDRMVLGHYSSSALGSLQISAILYWTLYSIFTAFSSGTLAVVARALGEGDKRGAERAASVSLGFAGALGVVVTVAILASLDFLLPRVFPHAGVGVRSDARAYLAFVLPCLPAGFIEASAAAALQAAGDTKTPLRAGVVANVLNLALSCTLVFGLFGLPALGVRGAAIGAASAMVVQAVLLLVALASRKSPLALRSRDLALGDTFRRLMRVSIPAYMEKVVYNGGYLLFVVIIARLGESAMAANQAMISIEGICFLTAEGFAVAAASLVARKLGAGKKHDAAEVAAIATRMSMALLTTCGIAFAVAPRLLMPRLHGRCGDHRYRRARSSDDGARAAFHGLRDRHSHESPRCRIDEGRPLHQPRRHVLRAPSARLPRGHALRLGSHRHLDREYCRLGHPIGARASGLPPRRMARSGRVDEGLTRDERFALIGA